MRTAIALLGNLLRVVLFPLWLLARRARRPRSAWIELRIAAEPSEIAMPQPLWRAFLARWAPRRLRSIAELRRLGVALGTDPRMEGMLVHIPHLRCGWATCASLRQELADVRARGKRVIAYLQLGGSERELYVASAADRVLVSPRAPVSLLGVSSEPLYFKRLLDRLGIELEVEARKQWKTAAEPFVREEMSEAQRVQTAALLAGIQGELEQALGTRPGLSPDAVRASFQRGVMGVRAAQAAGLIDGAVYEDELHAELGLTAPPVPADRYLGYRQMRFWRPLKTRPGIAIVPVHGMIVDGSATPGGRRTATLAGLTAALRAVARDPRVLGVLLYVDSPGGSALASDLIHRELVRLRLKKPVVAFMGDVAASGGYYVAAPCQRIVAQGMTLTGSIGVISARVLGGRLADKLGVRPQVVRSAPHADLHSPFRALDPEERALAAAEIDEVYAGFVGVVAEGRGRTVAEVEELAGGRVWSGADALRAGLVDELGGLPVALRALQALLPELRGVPLDQLPLRVVSGGPNLAPIAAEPARAPRFVTPEGVTRFVTPEGVTGVLEAASAELGELRALCQGTENALAYALIPKIR